MLTSMQAQSETTQFNRSVQPYALGGVGGAGEHDVEESLWREDGDHKVRQFLRGVDGALGDLGGQAAREGLGQEGVALRDGQQKIKRALLKRRLNGVLS